eukprot:CAMPEP_0172671720 /NCGR_PEP_ID=MMETSP1074-20121228/11093_1 /TAXON_ID=2916 /ORGANISM="Ceratium fusus, Strain PA161109" /LENGTH=418 /DNA_ID=CAMNT_0013488813 /DNA_START=39 /DNA_END=1295 /DNA_ORIENTATION=-
MPLRLLLALCVTSWSLGEGTDQQLPSCQEVIGTNGSSSAQCYLMTGKIREKAPAELDEDPADGSDEDSYPSLAEYKEEEFRDLRSHAKMKPFTDEDAAKLRLFCFAWTTRSDNDEALMPYARRLFNACHGHGFFTDMDAPGDDGAGDIVRVHVPPASVEPHGEGWLLNQNMIGLAPAWSKMFEMGVPAKYDWAVNLELDHFFIPSRIRRTIIDYLELLRTGTKMEVASLERPLMFAWGNAFLFDSRMMKLMSEHWGDIAKPITSDDGKGCPEMILERATQLGACQQDMAYPLMVRMLKKRSKLPLKMYGMSGCNSVPEAPPLFPLSCWQSTTETWPDARLALVEILAKVSTKATVEEAKAYCEEKVPKDVYEPNHGPAVNGDLCAQLWRARNVPIMHLFKNVEIHELGARLYLHSPEF